MLKLFISFLVILPLSFSYPHSFDPDSDEGIEEPDHNLNTTILELMNNGTNVNELISTSLFYEIEEEPFDAEHALTSCRAPDPPAMKNGITDNNRRWYKGDHNKYFVPVVIHPSYTEQEKNLVFAAMREIQDTTSCILFYIYNSASQLRGWDFVEITRENSGCFSEGLGKLGKGKQQMNLQPTDSRGLTCMIKGICVHELLHVLGFHHQQNSPDRDDFVTIVWDNIENSRGARYQFEKLSYSQATTYGTEYDFRSIMHYAKRDFSRNGGETIIAKKSGVSFGQRERISDIDAFKVKKMYNCPT